MLKIKAAIRLHLDLCNYQDFMCPVGLSFEGGELLLCLMNAYVSIQILGYNIYSAFFYQIAYAK